MTGSASTTGRRSPNHLKSRTASCVCKSHSQLEHRGDAGRRPVPGRGPRRLGRAPPLPAPPPRAVAVNQPAGALPRRGPPAHQVMGRFPGESSCLALVFAVLDLLHRDTPQTARRSPSSTANTSTESNTDKPTQTPSTRGRSQPQDRPGNLKAAANSQRLRDATPGLIETCLCASAGVRGWGNSRGRACPREAARLWRHSCRSRACNIRALASTGRIGFGHEAFADVVLAIQ